MLSDRFRNAALAFLWRACQVARRQNRLVVLTFHRVLESADPLRPDEIGQDDFREAMRAIVGSFPVVSLGEALRRGGSSNAVVSGVAITFDDGYRDNAELALPILAELGIPATFFVATGFLDGKMMWNDTVIEAVRRMPGDEMVVPGVIDAALPIRTDAQRLNATIAVISQIKHLERSERQTLVNALASPVMDQLPNNMMMRRSDVEALASAGMAIGGHTIDHPILSKETAEEALRQVAVARRELQKLSRQEVELFAYPNGRPDQDFGQREAELVMKAGFTAAFTTSWGSIHAGSNLFQLPRISLWDWRPANIGLRICQSLFRDGETSTT